MGNSGALLLVLAQPRGVAEELLLPQLVAAQVGLVVNYILNRAGARLRVGGALFGQWRGYTDEQRNHSNPNS